MEAGRMAPLRARISRDPETGRPAGAFSARKPQKSPLAPCNVKSHLAHAGQGASPTVVGGFLMSHPQTSPSKLATFSRAAWTLALSLALALVSASLVAQPAQATGGTASAIGLSAGDLHTCILKASGNVHCYGDNDDGQAAAYTGGDATAVSAGRHHTCVLKANGNVDCYGDNTLGQAADYTGGDATAVSAGGFHTCVLKANGNVDCYGANSDGQSNDYTSGDAMAVSTGREHTCILKTDRNVDCYGYNFYGQAADRTTGDALAVDAGDLHTCVLRANNNVDCYGNNPFGQASDYTGGDAIAVSTGYGHTCVLKVGNNVHCYGLNGDGQTAPYTAGDATAVSVGAYHTCILTVDGNVPCHGENLDGQSQNYGVPTAPTGLAITSNTSGITLTWSAPAEDGQFPLSDYTIYRGFSSQAKTPLDTVPSSQLSYVDTTCPLATRCYYQVTALNSFGEGPRSSEVSALGQHTPMPTGVESCAVFNSANGNPYPGQQGLVVKYADGTHAAACAAPATASQCPVAGVVVNNVPTCVETCGTPGPGWSVGAQGECLEAPWVSVHPLYPDCPSAATVGIVVYGLGGGVLFTICV